MRMWMVNPEILCRNHLLGEHSEIHKHKHNFEKHHSINKRIELGQIEPEAMKHRHDVLALEMIRRGYNHNSEYSMPDITYLPEYQRSFKVNTEIALIDLLNRCEHCRAKVDKMRGE